MRRVIKERRGVFSLLVFIVLFSLLGACSPGLPASKPISSTPSPTSMLRLYLSSTPTSTTSPISPFFNPTEIPTPTSTPFLYKVVADDTMIGIAWRFSVTLEELQAANPEVDPRFLTVGTDLVIPLGEEGNLVAEVTPVAVVVAESQCYIITIGGVWCFVVIENDQPNALENLSGLVHLYNSAGELVASQEANTLLNLLAPGETVPLVAYFSPPVPEWSFSRSQLLTAIEVEQVDGRYIEVTIEKMHSSIDDSGMIASVSGDVVLLGGEDTSANWVWVVMVAYDENGKVVGIRRWESVAELAPGGKLPFEMQVYSLGSTIARVQGLVEARP